MKYVADFETTSSSQYEIDGYTRVWAVAVMDIESEELELLSNNIDDFFAWAFTDNRHHKTKEVYFHNLKFDGPFIIDWLFKNGFKHSKERKLKEKEFSTLISNTGIWYNITICYKRFKTRANFVKIFDSLKKLPMSEERIAKSFNLEVQKGSIDYDKYRPVGYEMNEDEKEYIISDVKIMAQALKIQFNQGLTKMTIGSDAMDNFKKRLGNKNYKYLFPVLDNTIDSDLRLSYKGGWTYLKPEYAGKVIKNVLSYDVNSLYPSVMKSPHLLPFGEPIYFKGKYKYDKVYPLYIQYIRCRFEIKKDHLPTIQLKNNWLFKSTEYLTSSGDEVVNLALTSIDLKLFLDHYNVYELEYLEGFKFMGITGIFDEYIDYWYNIKNNSKDGVRELAKLMLNNLYGKFGTNPRFIPYIPTFVDGEVKYLAGDEEIRNSVYVPMASFITAYARNKTIRSAQKLYDHFVYADTDSLKLINITHEEVCKIIDVDNEKLGAWGYEGMSELGKFLKPKTYILSTGGKLNIKVAGLSKEGRDNITFDNFKLGYQSSDASFKAKKVKGGVILEKRIFTIK